MYREAAPKSCLGVEVPTRPGAVHAGNVGAVSLDKLQTPFEIAGLDRPDKGIAAIVAASPGVITPPASAEVTALIAAARSPALSIGGKTNLAARSRHCSSTPAIQTRNPAGSPPSPTPTA